MQSLLISPPPAIARSPARSARFRTLFRDLEVHRENRWRSFSLSAAFHIFVVLSMPLWPNQFTDRAERQAWLRQERLLRTMRIRIPEQLYIASPGSQTARPKPALRYQNEQTARPARDAEGARRGRASGRRRRFELPEALQRPNSDQTLIQPRYEASLAPPPQLELPEVFFWSPHLGPQNTAKVYVQPGHAAPPSGPRVLDAQPRLDTPVLSLNSIVAGWDVFDPTEMLNPSDALPIRSAFGDASHNAATADPLKGDPSTVLSVSANPLPLREYLTVPPGNQVGRTPSVAPEGREGGAGTGRGRQGSGSGDAAQNGNGAGLNGTGGDDDAGAGLPSEVQATRIDHPANGVFDVVVQSSGLEGFPESAGVLSGKPVFSVFLAVGAARDWILQYCIPFGEEVNAIFEDGVVKLGTPTRVQSPYPRLTFRPDVGFRQSGFMMLHGFITEAGRFQDLKILGVNDPGDSASLAALERWEFRPASRNGAPVRVEILLAIPTE